MLRKISVAGISFLMVVVLFVGFLGCGGDDDGGGGGSADIGDDELVQKVIAAENDFETVSFTMDMDMSMDGEGMGESFSMAVNMSGDGAMDNANQKMKMEMDMSIKMDMGFMGDMDFDTDMEMYIIGDVSYTKTGEIMGMPAQWIKMEMPGTWEQRDMVSQQTDLLEAAKLNISDGGKVNGVSTYKVEMTPSMRDLYNILMSQQGISEGVGAGSLPSDMEMEEIADMIKDFSVVQWYDKDTYFPMKAELSMTMEMTDDMMGMGGGSGEMDMDMSMTINFKDYNESVSISLPSDAKNATDMSDMMDFGGDWDSDWDMDDFEFDEDDLEDMFGDMDWDDEDWDWGN